MQCHTHRSSRSGIGWKVPLGIVLVLLGVAAAVAATQRGGATSSPATAPGGGRLIVEPPMQELGELRMGGGLRRLAYTVKNTGSGPLTITDMETSCMCTTVSLETGGKTGPTFGMRTHGKNPRGWSQVLQPGESGILRVVFDPNAHGRAGVGAVSRTITIRSNDDTAPVTQIGFTGTVTP